ncbi:MAG: NHLP family bacteriocin export ABC transporter peptidase/permease/ATPase subunit [Clostridiales bacterium]
MAKKRVRVPVVMQMEMLECGAACLAMILAYHGKWLPLERVREDCGVSRDGSKAKNILIAARSYGLIAKGYRSEVDDLKNAAFPCIIHWNFNHFVVLKGFSDKYAYINDPAAGEIHVPIEVFDKSYTGVYLHFEKTAAFKLEGKPKSVIQFAKARLKGTLVPFLFVVLTGLLTSAIGVINPALSRMFMDRVLTGQNPEWLAPVIFAMAALAAASITMSFLNTLYLLKIRGKLAIVANVSFLWHVLRLPMSFFSQRMAGDIAGRQSSNEGIAETLMSQLAPLFLNFILVFLYFIIMLRYSLILTALGLFSIVVNMLMAQIISKKRVNIMRGQMRNMGKLSGLTVGGIEMIETIKSSGAENGFFEQWSGTQAAVNTAKIAFNKANLYLGAIPGLISSLTSIAILATGVYLIMQGRFTAGMLLAFQSYLASFTAPAQSLIEASQSLQQMRILMERIEDVMNYAPDVVLPELPDNLDDFDKLQGNIEMKDVTFGYSKLEPPLIEAFSMTLKAGQSVAFVGSSGCGKSTLAKLISGLYKPWSGQILFDGKPYADIDRNMFTSSLAVVDQDIVIFEDTVSANVKLWDESIEDFEAILACRDAGLHQDILQRPEGYKHKLTEGGKNFSGGQRQRIEIARSLAADPSILIMDEATSALDAKTEFDVTSAIRQRGITCVIIAHRLSTIRDCDEIIVLDKGKVVERGSHDELAGKGGYYTRLVTTE